MPSYNDDDTNLVSYDVNKDGVRVAVLTFPKSAYRLGETVLGVVEINEPWSRSRVLSVGGADVTFSSSLLIQRCNYPRCWELKNDYPDQ